MRATYNVKAIVFDLDGVLVDSMSTIKAYWSDWGRRHGIAAETVVASLHLTAEELVRKFAPALDPVAEARATAVQQAELEMPIVALEGSDALLRSLPPSRWAVVTSGRRALAVRHLALGKLPEPGVLITAEDTPRGKPDPSGYRLAARRLRVEPTECLAVEDSVGGVRAARDAGMIVIGMSAPYDEAELAEADGVIHALTAIQVREKQDGSLEVAVTLDRQK